METISGLKPYTPLPFYPLKSSSPWAVPSRNNVIFARFSRTQSDHKLGSCPPIHVQNHRNIQRNTIVRSAIAGAAATMSGSPENPSYSISEFQLGSRIRAICFYAMTAVAVIPLFAVMVLVHPLVMLFDRYRRRAHHLVAKVWAWATIVPFYRFEMEGLENLPAWDVPAVCVSNHQSFLDIYTLLMHGRSFKFISKTGIFVIPVVVWAVFLMGLIPLRRMDSRSQLASLKRSMDLVEKGHLHFSFRRELGLWMGNWVCLRCI